MKNTLLKVTDLLNKVYAFNKARKELGQELQGKRGDPLLDARGADGKLSLAAYRADNGDSQIDVNAVNEKIRELNDARALAVKELRATVNDLRVYVGLFADGVLNDVITDAIQWGLNPDFILDDTDSVVKVQRAKNGKGAGVIVPNV